MSVSIGSTTPAEHPSASRPFVVVVDDSVEIRSLVEDVLRAEGYEVASVPSGPRALEVMSQRRPDVVITDLLMPGMSGFSFRALLMRRSDLRAIPVIVMSGYWQRPSETLDADALLTKPIDVDRLVAVVGEVVSKRTAG
jgi:CheY-like chemotaxis protein